MKAIKLEKCGCTDIGHNRPLNEDYFEIQDDIFVLADGMGGHNAGEIASQLAVKYTMNIFKNLIRNNSLELFSNHNIQKQIHDVIIRVNKKLYEKSLEDIHLHGMGTTIVLALHQKPNCFHIANVGDSRAYLFRRDSLELLSEDHSVTGSLLKNGTITQSEVKNHPYRHHLTRSIGSSDHVVPFVQSFDAETDDIILLCSDGLWNSLIDDDIIETLKKNYSSKRLCYELQNKAKEYQSEDNITAIVIKII